MREVKLRYRSAPLPCTLEKGTLTLAEPAWGVAPGQTAVLLQGDRILGCATIAP